MAIGAIVKNEGPYILEWVAYHRVLGIERFFIADNNSDDGTTELLATLRSIGLIDHIRFPHVPGKAPQLPAYVEIMRRHARDAEWIAFIDADEFFHLADDYRSIPLLFNGFGRDVGAVVVNWATYGSSFRTEPSQGLVVERFIHRAEKNFGVNHHYKSVLRPSAYLSHSGTPHHFKVGRKFRHAYADGKPLSEHPVHGIGLSASVCWSPLRLNHYVVKSRAEFDRKKAARGRATTTTDKRGEDFFLGHDRNEVRDPMPAHLVQATNEEMEKIRTALRRNGCDEPIIRLDDTVSALTPFACPDKAMQKAER
ncbi:glycosyltransferase family 2 protein [Nitratireductor luteus]|uniref:glycosyltransferase family 2 protein n=1 Tax=Nitratireductor luteus TaxID=2976980 RepID=UPI00223EE61E|nr:glycosyltransferase family 2 protein [Nitratireductor luteus]